jgi:WD40 repeat protein
MAVSVDISPDGRKALSTSQDRSICLWDVQTGQQLQLFLGHTEGVISAAFSQDGRRILSGGRDKTLRLWSMPENLRKQQNKP